jgi:hypothetical protein
VQEAYALTLSYHRSIIFYGEAQTSSAKLAWHSFLKGLWLELHSGVNETRGLAREP